ncbi:MULTISPECIES: hypothetical protein [Clostridium]|jgi:hypothetical protein|uniref:Uncharacterized protein n=4 Tax=Clostridium TaxID=1485 RepID=A0A1B9BLI4_CLOBE|nr:MULTISPECIES: hypothetical protein [Clostridium]ABR36745.1 conserved hypothetical protein [Clostridium beijerinckii NCIMB 8052]AIU01372.1 hypothetical protein Cbs_4637 [Clostridium beijerinckii ATCC 35702]ALB44251.1 hypothetical protein X276_02655 [Clostridium beijerinckii NRRL B-598]AQS07496.1 hypothetical protein CLBIJ_49460 [Clostridium beijerinckii]AVK48564.1 hypothetical protein AXY43_11225 [Clostridium sp. MF28]
MILINCALRQDDIINIVENIEVENEKVFKFVRKEGIKILFECSLSDQQNAAAIAKQSIKDTELGKVLYFGVSVQ